MSRWIDKLLNGGLAARMVLLVLAALLLAQAITFFILRAAHEDELERERRYGLVSRVGEVARLAETLPPNEAERMVRVASSPVILYRLDAVAVVSAEEASRFPVLGRRLQRRFDEVRVAGPGNWNDSQACSKWRKEPYERHHWHDDDDDDDLEECGPNGARVSIKLANGGWLNVALDRPEEVDRAVVPAATSWAVSAVLLIALVLLIAYRISRPLKQLSAAAEALGRGERPDQLPEEGPKELAAMAGAFNRMSDRLDRFVRDRTRLLAAISHDMRTPITSLRLRAEFIDDDGLRDKMLATIDEMQAMTEATLAFAREEAVQEDTRPTDLSALVAALCDDQIDLGHDVTSSGPGRLVIRCRPVAIKRALRNVIENAVRYGGLARVSLAENSGRVVLTIEDDGPGIPEEKRTQVFEPFVRLEESRSRATGGVGLGLATARTVIHAHGGDIQLTAAVGGGLKVIITLPIG